MKSMLLAPAALSFIVYHLLVDGAPKGIPRMGKPGGIGYFITALRFTINTERVLHEARKLFAGASFAVPSLAGWVIVLHPRHLETLRSSDDTVFNQPIQVSEMLQFDHILNSNQQATPFHMSTVRKEFTKGIPKLLPKVLDETTVVLGQTLKPLPGSEYTKLKVMHDVPYIVARITNRAVVGTDLCRNEGFISAVVHFTETVFVHGRILLWSPVILRPLAYFILSSVWGGSKQPLAFLKPYLVKRLEERTLSDDHPFNLAELLINDAPPHLASDLNDLSMRILNINFAGIHTSSLFFSHTLFELAQMSTEDIDSMRTEVEQALGQEGGWTKSSLNKFTKIDSILREIARFHGLSSLGMSRRTIADGHLTDGTTIPAGYEVAFDLKRIHLDPEVYPDPYRFDPFRFSKIRADSKDPGAKNGFTTVDNHFLPFGLGRHVCPGRFFASMQLKVMVAHFLLSYDVKLPPGQTTRPKNVVYAGAVFPPLNAHLLIKPRRGNMA